MGKVSEQWQEICNARADELCMALVRMPRMTYVQAGRLLGLTQKQVHRVVAHSWDRIVQVPYRARCRSPRFTISSHRLKFMLKLTDTALKEWSQCEGVPGRSFVKHEDVDRMLSVADILVNLRVKGMLYETWDMMLPKINEGLHAMIQRYDGATIGMYLMPMQYGREYETKHRSVQRGILRRVTQHINETQHILFLVPAAYYSMTLDILSKLHSDGGRHLYLIPLESFLGEPEKFLNSIVDGEKEIRNSLWAHLNKMEILPHSGGYNYPILGRFDKNLYRFVDTYFNGGISRVREWLDDWHMFGYVVPGTGAVALASVYVYDSIMYEGLAKLLESKGPHMTEVYPWPASADILYCRNR